MLSIIVSSCNEHFLFSLKRNIKETAEVENEILAIENSDAKYSLTEAYNRGGSIAKYPFLLFVHEDVLFKTKGWGKTLIDHLENLENVGIVGIAGTDYKPFVPSGWAFDLTRPLSYHLIQGSKQNNLPTALTEANHDSVRRVICLDGVFLALRRSVFEKIRFDEDIKGFHGYDTDFSLSVSQEYQNYFVPDIFIEHFSEGKISDQWLINIFQIHQKWKAKLPKSMADDGGIDMESELSAYRVFLDLLSDSSLPTKSKVMHLIKITGNAVNRTHSPKFITAFFYAIKERLFREDQKAAA